MRTLPWRRATLIERIKRDLWRYLTPSATVAEQLLDASALLQMRPSDLRTVGSLQFLVSPELRKMLEDVPMLLRRLANTTVSDEEWSIERIRGSIQWGRTLGVRHATGIPHLYVTAPSRRAYQTPENEALVFVLDETIALGRRSGWARSEVEAVGRTIRDRVSEAERWSQSRMLTEIERRPITPRARARINSGRYRRRYASVIAAYDRYRDLVGRLDRESLQHAVETYGLISRDDPTLFELHCTFQVLGGLERLGWRIGRLGLFAGSLRLAARREEQTLEITYQAVPRSLRRGSAYRTVQAKHGISTGPLRPDLVLLHRHGGQTRWIIVEVKGGHRRVEESARAALYDLLAYRTAFDSVLEMQSGPYGLGVAWGAELGPSQESDVLLCTPDCLDEALKLALR